VSHNITIVKTEDGRQYEEAFFAGKNGNLNPAWHGLGVNVIDAQTSSEAIELANLDWEVSLMPVAGVDDVRDSFIRSEMDSNGNSEFYTVVRDFEQTKKILGIVGDKYKPVQNWESFDFVDSLIKDNEILYESAGSLKGGKVVWLLARLPKIDYVTPEDPMKRYLLFSNSHDGSKAIRVVTTNVRVVCNNTLTNALSNNSDGIKIRHVGDIKSKINAARNVLSKINKEFKAIHELEKSLAKASITKNDFSNYVDVLFPIPKDEDGNELEKGNSLSQRNNKVLSIFDCYKDERQQFDSIKDTAWSAYNAVTQYVDHDSRVRVTEKNPENEARMNSSLFEGGARIKRKAFNLAVEMFV